MHTPGKGQHLSAFWHGHVDRPGGRLGGQLLVHQARRDAIERAVFLGGIALEHLVVLLRVVIGLPLQQRVHIRGLLKLTVSLCHIGAIVQVEFLPARIEPQHRLLGFQYPQFHSRILVRCLIQRVPICRTVQSLAGLLLIAALQERVRLFQKISGIPRFHRPP